MKNLQLTFALLSFFVLTSCTNTWEGIKADKRDVVAWSHAKPSSMEKLVGPVPVGYAGNITTEAESPEERSAQKESGLRKTYPVSSATSRSISSSGLVWHKIDDYDSTQPILPERSEPLPPSSSAFPQESGIIRYNQSVNVFPVNGDVEPYTQVMGPDMVVGPVSGEMVEQIFFAHGSASINKTERRNLRELGESLARTSNPYRLSVIGHASKRVNGVTDPVQKKMINFEMAQKRANVVTEQLRAAGADPSWVMASSRGDVDPNRRPGGKSREAADRRVEVYMDNM